MKKIFSFLFVFLLSAYMTADMWAQGAYPVNFSSEDATNEHWYNVNFRRHQALGKFWMVDHDFTGAIYEKVMTDGFDQRFQWKFVLLEDETNKFYIVNRASGEYVASDNAGFSDSYGMPVPPTVKNPSGADWDATGTIYYIDETSIGRAAIFEFKYSTSQAGWGIIDTGNSRALNDINGWHTWVGLYSLDDVGSILSFAKAGVPVISSPLGSLTIGSVKDKTATADLPVNARSLEGNIEAVIEGNDAEYFSAILPENFKGGVMVVSFTPTEERAHKATLRLKTNGGADLTIALNGNVYLESELPKISSEDNTNENWYYIQFSGRLTENKAWTASTGMGQVSQQVIPSGNPDEKQMWKICGSWENGFFFVNKAIGGELLYNQMPDQIPVKPVVPGLVYAGSDAHDGTDTYIVTNSGALGNEFNFVRTNGYWQLYNRDINSAPKNTARTPDGFDARYVYDRDGNHIRQSSGGNSQNQLVFTAVKPMIKTNVGAAYLMKAAAGETAELTITVTGIATSAGITASLTGDAVFKLSANSLPAAGGELIVTFSPDVAEFYQASLKLSSAGTDDVIISLTGSDGGPVFCTDDTDVWHYVQFSRRAGENKVWQNNGTGEIISQALKVEGKKSQQWKFSGTPDNFVIENREGGLLAFDAFGGGGNTNERALINEDEGNTFAVVHNAEAGTWAFKHTSRSDGLNDYQGNYICTYGTGDAGSLLLIFPVEAEPIVRKVIKANTASNALAAPAGETATAKVIVTGINVTETITATLSGADVENFSLSASTLPAAGGELTITFTPSVIRSYKATLTLSSAGVKDVVMPFDGLGAPEFSTQGNDVWHYIQFERTEKVSKVWQGDGNGWLLAQEQREEDIYGQHWKFVGVWNEGFVIENREGGQVFFEKEEDEEGEIYAAGKATLAEEGDPFLLIQNGARWELQLAEFTNISKSFMNDWDNNGGNSGIGLWTRGDGGNFVKFIPVDNTVNIKNPVIDPTDQLIAKKYYTLQGIEVKQPAATGLYIVKKVYASGKTLASKELIIVR